MDSASRQRSAFVSLACIAQGGAAMLVEKASLSARPESKGGGTALLFCQS